MADEKKIPAAVAAQIEKARMAWGKLGDELDALEAMVAQEPTPSQLAKQILSTYMTLWNQRYPGRRCVPNWPKDMAIAKRLLKHLDVDEIGRRLVTFFQMRDAFYTDAWHPLGMFASSINKLGGRGPGSDEDLVLSAPPPDCKHTPRCRTDVEHTRKLTARPH